ncbi:MAG: hypothetical protein ACOXZK_11650 [Bacteroidales bacterium]|jgi:hypothetical protein|nr:hypothetical protein [Bacteroidales bacterium]
MSSTKTMNALGVYTFYSQDYLTFIKSISEMFNVNIDAYFSPFFENEEEEKQYEIEDQLFDFGKKETYRLAVYFLKFDAQKPVENNLYCSYGLYLPVDFEYEKELFLEFYATGVFHLQFLPFNTTWKFFIEDIIGLSDHYYQSEMEIIEEVKTIRNKYIDILAKIDCKEVILWTDSYYKTEYYIEDANDFETKLSFNDIINCLKDTDNLTIYNFAQVLGRKIKIENSKYNYTDVVLYDNFEDEILYIPKEITWFKT